MYQCSTCPAKLSTKAGLAKHEFCHTGQKPHICSTCGARFAVREYLMNHMKGHSSERNFTCKTCGKSFTRKSTLNAHLETHTVGKNYSCSQCGKCFTTKITRDNHTKVHYEEKVHTCHICGKSFGCLSYLKKHTDAHLGIKKYKCEQCGKAYPNRNIYEEHLRRHAGEKVVQCQFCPQRFYSQRELKTHMKFHSKETLFKCDQCQMYFKSVRSLQNHISKRHIEPLGCEFCSKVFMNKRTLKTHMLTNHKNIAGSQSKMPKHLQAGFKKVLCDMCGKVLSNKYRLRTHLRVKHALNKAEISKKEAELRGMSLYDEKVNGPDESIESNKEIGEQLKEESRHISVFQDVEAMVSPANKTTEASPHELHRSVVVETIETDMVHESETIVREPQHDIVVIINEKEEELGTCSPLDPSIQYEIVELDTSQEYDHVDTRGIRYITENGEEIILATEKEETKASDNCYKTENSLEHYVGDKLETDILNEKCTTQLAENRLISLDDSFPVSDTADAFLKFENALRVRIYSLSEYNEYEAFLDRTIKTLQYARYKHRQKTITS